MGRLLDDNELMNDITNAFNGTGKFMVFDETKRNETKQSVFDETKRNETKQSLTLEKSGNCSSAAPNTLDTIAVLFR